MEMASTWVGKVKQNIYLPIQLPFSFLSFFLFFFVVLGLELKASTLNHSTSPFL
jgi:hypothetical protein